VIVWVAVEVNVGAFGSNVTEVNNRPNWDKAICIVMKATH